MPRNYKCDYCGREVDRSNLFVKQVSFREMGRGGKLVRQRSVGWICKDLCLAKDKAWQQEPLKLQMQEKKS